MIKRTIFNELVAHLDKKEMSLIIGPRQSGKTTIMLLLKEFLEQNDNKCAYLNLDIEADKVHFDSQEALLNKISLEVGKDKSFVFIDEIQRKENAGLFLKGLYDMGLPYKFIISGSGSVELKEKVHESLAGRKRLFELSTLSFEEFVNYKTDYKYEDKIQDFFKVERNKTTLLLYEYLNFGGYPRVVLEQTALEKNKIIAELYQSYIEKDISYLLNIQKTDDFTRLVRILASQVGELTNISELSSTLGLSLATTRNYLWYLEKTFVVYKLTPYFKNVRKEITKSPVMYYYDLGLRNYVNGSFGNLSNPADIGFLFQNFVANELRLTKDQTLSELHFWRTTDKAEVDFVHITGSKVTPFEVKFRDLKSSEVSKSLHSFITKYSPENVVIVHLGDEFSTKISRSNVTFVPFYKLCASEKWAGF